MRFLKIAGAVAAALLALVIVALVLIVIFVNPNDYKDDLARIVQSKTGRHLTLAGDLKLSVFPWLAIELGAAQLADGPGFGPEPFLSLQHARLSVRVLPLLRGKLEVGEVLLDAPSIRLVTDEQGRNNWADLGSSTSPEPTASTSRVEIPQIAGLQIRDGHVLVENRKDKSRLVVDKLKLKSGALAGGKPFDLTLGVTVARGEDRVVDADLKTEVTANPERNSFSLSGTTADLLLKGPAYPAAGIPIKVRVPSLDLDVANKRYTLTKPTIDVQWSGKQADAKAIPIALAIDLLRADLVAQTLQLNGLQARVADAQMHGALTGKEIIDAPQLTGRLTLVQLNLRDWMKQVGVAMPVTQDADVYKRLQFDGTVTMTASSAMLDNVTLKLDDTTAKGSVGVVDFASSALRFNLDIDRINADRYLPPQVAAKDATVKTDEKPTPIPVDLLRTLNLRGDIKVAEAIFSGIRFSKLHLGINARDGVLRLNPSEASMYSGQYHGDIGLDATGAKARVTMDEHIAGIDFAPLFSDLFKSKRVSGKGSANLKINASGNDTREMLKALNGNLDFSVANGALEGADLWYEIRRARALIRQQPTPARSGPERTPFQSMRGTGVFINGVLSNDDLDVALQYLKVTGKGKADLVGKQLDYHLVATVLKIPAENAQTEGMGEMADAQIPVIVTGSFDAPKVRPDIEGYLKGQARQRIDVEKKKLEDKVRNKLQDKLKGILGG